LNLSQIPFSSWLPLGLSGETLLKAFPCGISLLFHAPSRRSEILIHFADVRLHIGRLLLTNRLGFPQRQRFIQGIDCRVVPRPRERHAGKPSAEQKGGHNEQQNHEKPMADPMMP
jgi:hypothetical protein